MDEARARRLQPHYIRAFFIAAFKLLGGRISERESGRYEIRHVPADIRDRDRQIGLGAPVLTKYERVTFDKELTRPVGKPKADLLAPGHPLLDAVTDLIIERYGTLLKQGTMLVDRHDPGDIPRLLVAVTHEITDGHDPARTITKRFGFAEISPDADGTAPAPDGVRAAGEARYLDYGPLEDSERAVVMPLRDAPWLSVGVDKSRWTGPSPRVCPKNSPGRGKPSPARVSQVRRLVRQRLTGEINYWDMRHAELLDAQSAGRSLKMKPETALRASPRPGAPSRETPRGPGAGRGTDRAAAGRLRRGIGYPSGTARQAARKTVAGPGTHRSGHGAYRPPRRRRRPGRRTSSRPRAPGNAA